MNVTKFFCASLESLVKKVRVETRSVKLKFHRESTGCCGADKRALISLLESFLAQDLQSGKIPLHVVNKCSLCRVCCAGRKSGGSFCRFSLLHL